MTRKADELKHDLNDCRKVFGPILWSVLVLVSSCNKPPAPVPFKHTAAAKAESSDSNVGDHTGTGNGSDPSIGNGSSNPGSAQPNPQIPVEPKRGIEWSDDRIFPTFQNVSTLDVVDRRSLNDDSSSAIITLQGIVNRGEPRIFILNDNKTSPLWLKEIGGTQTSVANPLDLIIKYKEEIKGMVIYDDHLLDTLNLATTIAGIEDVIAVSPNLAATLQAAPYSLKVFKDLRENKFKNAIEAYQWQFDTYSAKASHRIIFGLNPTMRGYLRDYAVATKAMMIWLNPEGDEKPLLDRYLALMAHNSPYLGWWKDEPKGVHEASLYGVPVYAADWSSNLTAMGGQHEAMKKPITVPAPKLENKIYVSVFISDGDNLQEDETLIPLKWADENRGKIPTAWTISPALVDIAPVIINYFQRTATPNDVLVSGPSGLGYTYPGAWPAGTFVKYAKVSGEYMARSGLNIITLWNDRVDLTEEINKAYFDSIPDLLGMTIMDESRELQFVANKLPIHRLTLSYGDTEEICSHGVEESLKKFNGSRPVFASIQANMNKGTIHPTAITQLAKRYENNPNVVFVRPDHFFQLLKQANGK